MLTSYQSHWGVDQWVGYLRDKEIPVLPRTQSIMRVMREEEGAVRESLAPRELADLAYADPFLALKLLRNAEHRRSRRLGQETTTVLAAVLQLGVDNLLELVSSSATCDDTHPGLNHCEFRSVLAASISRAWAVQHADASPDEVALAALLSECGELLLWHFMPELPQKAEDELAAGRAGRTLKAQQQALGFTFKQLTLALVEAWELPGLIAMLIRGTDTLRANIARLAIDTARHIVSDDRNPALPADIANIHRILPGAGYQSLVAPLPIPDDHKQAVIALVERGAVPQFGDAPQH